MAEESYSKYLSSNPKDVEAWFQKGLSNYYYADYEKAIGDFSEVFLLNENYTSALEWRGICHQKANLIRKACKDWQLAVDKGLSSSQEYIDRYCGESE